MCTIKHAETHRKNKETNVSFSSGTRTGPTNVSLVELVRLFWHINILKPDKTNESASSLHLYQNPWFNRQFYSSKTAFSHHALSWGDQHISNPDINFKLDTPRVLLLFPTVVLLHLSGAPDPSPACQINRSFWFEHVQTGAAGQERQGQTVWTLWGIIKPT